MKTHSFKNMKISAIHLPLLCILSTVCSGTEIMKEGALSSSSGTLQDYIEIPAVLPTNLIDHEQHHPKLTRDQKEGLIQKGYSLLKRIVNGEEVDSLHKLEFLSHYKDLDDHWKLPGIAYGDRSQRKVILESAKYITISPVSYLYNKAATCFWSSLENPEEEGGEVTSSSLDLAYSVSFEDWSLEHTRKAHLESVVALIWALYDMSYKTGNAFVRGSIILDDSEKRIHRYLENYCCLAANVTSPKQLSGVLYNPWGSNLAYNRQGRSSHFVGRTLTNYGIDTRFQPRNFALGVLPYYMTHLLFGRVMTTTGEEITLIKAEEEGLGDLRAAAKHALNYALPVSSPHMRREKDISQEIAESFFKLLVTLQKNPEFLNAFMERESAGEGLKVLLNKLYQNRLMAKDLEKSETVDIAGMYEFLWAIKQNKMDNPESLISEDILLQSNSLLENLKKLYNRKTLFMRTGNEVLFSDKELYGILDIPFVHRDNIEDEVLEKK